MPLQDLLQHDAIQKTRHQQPSAEGLAIRAICNAIMERHQSSAIHAAQAPHSQPDHKAMTVLQPECENQSPATAESTSTTANISIIRGTPPRMLGNRTHHHFGCSSC